MYQVVINEKGSFYDKRKKKRNQRNQETEK